MMRTAAALVAVSLTLSIGLISVAPIPAIAAEEDANAKCKGKKDGTPVEAQGGRVKGTCQKEQFKAESSDGKAIDAGLQALMQALQGMLGKLGGGGGGGGSGSGAGAGGTPGGATANPLGDTTNSILNSLLGRNSTTTPDAPKTTAKDILDSAFDTTDDTRTTTILNPDGTTQSTSSVDTEIRTVLEGDDAAKNTPGTTVVERPTGNNDIPLPSGETASGDDGAISTGRVQPAGVTQNGKGIEVRVRENGGSTEVAGFYGGSGTVGGSVQGAVSRVCTSRPWATNFLARLIRPSFFDNLCVRLGFSVTPPEAVRPAAPLDTTKAQRAVKERVQQGTATTTGTLRGPGIVCNPEIVRAGKQAVLDFSCGSAKLTAVAGFTAQNTNISSATVKPSVDTKYGIQCSDNTVYTCTVQVVNPRLTIWAEPKEVTLGARSTVYWTAADVFADTCFVKGPSFLERGARGGAATVPINDPSTFTLACLAEDGATTTASVTIELDL
ncbi:MAG: hypothetical protein KBE09_00780 [Candidatus Pacebacteria bacterium]|nr:hypothetical protein [Candidatus Paceibacterota bacterium]